MTDRNFIDTAVSNQDEYSQYPRVTRKINRNIIPVSIDEFKKRAAKKHDNKYDYSLVQFTMLSDKVTIICPYHGKFKKIVGNHLRGGGCQQCAKIYNGQKLSSFVAACMDGIAELYVIMCTTKLPTHLPKELFYKVGITTKTVEQRYVGDVAMPYDYEILYRLKNDAESIYHLEKILLKSLNKYKYQPRKRFGGESECFSTIEPILYILEKINIAS